MKLPVGPKQIQQATRWFGSLATFGTAGALGGLYFTDWKLVLQYVPFYGSKFPKEEEK
ncbi:unnamed protein product [Diamesa hyperborea]